MHVQEVSHRLNSLSIVHVFIYKISTEDLCIKSVDRYKITLLLQLQLFVFILLFYFILKYSFLIMIIFFDNINNCEEKCIYNVSIIPMTTRIKVETARI